MVILLSPGLKEGGESFRLQNFPSLVVELLKIDMAMAIFTACQWWCND